MKKQNKNLAFSKKTVTELSNKDLLVINGGGTDGDNNDFFPDSPTSCICSIITITLKTK